jgi:hypothetical protein
MSQGLSPTIVDQVSVKEAEGVPFIGQRFENENPRGVKKLEQ